MVDYGLEYYSTDIVQSPGLDYVADMSDSLNVARVFAGKQFGAVFVLNVIEHVFEPLKVLDCSLSLVRDGGVLVVIAPVLWSIHNYPKDYCRFLPNWFEGYADSRGCQLMSDTFFYLGYGRVDEFHDGNGVYSYPYPAKAKSYCYYKSKAIHKVFNTFGRGMNAPGSLAIGVVYKK